MSINLDQVVTELGNYNRNNNKIVQPWVYNQDSQLTAYARAIAKVKGKFPAFHSVSSNVIQQFASTWNAMGTSTFKVNELVDYHQKVNFSIIPADIENSWLADLYTRELTPEAQPISKYIMDMELAPRVKEDIVNLEISGTYDVTKPSTFGFSMNGIETILSTALADTSNPAYRIVCPALTSTNALDVMQSFERQIPAKVRRNIKRVFMPRNAFDNYQIDFRNTYGTTYLASIESRGMRTVLYNWEIVPLDFATSAMPDIWTTLDGNMLKLIDLDTPPAITDIQKLDYEVKIFMEFWLGYGFWINQLVFAAVHDGSNLSGLKVNQSTYY